MFSGPGGLAHCHSCLDHLSVGLLQCALHGPGLEDNPKVTTGPACSSVCFKVCLCSTIAVQAVLAFTCFLGAIQCWLLLSSLKWLQDHLKVSVHPARSDNMVGLDPFP